MGIMIFRMIIDREIQKFYILENEELDFCRIYFFIFR